MAINIDGLKKELLSNLGKDNLKQYIFYLTKKYYVSYLEGDEETFKTNLDLLNDIILRYNEQYMDLQGFVFYCFFLNANAILSKQGASNEFALANPFKCDLHEDDELDEDLNHDIKKIFNKERVRARYNEEKTS